MEVVIVANTELFSCQRLCLFMTQLHVTVTHLQTNEVCSCDHFPLNVPLVGIIWCLFIVLPLCFCSELGSNPLKSAGIDDGAFADLKRVSYIRIADTEITEIPKGKAQSFAAANCSYVKGVWLSRSLFCQSVPKEREKNKSPTWMIFAVKQWLHCEQNKLQ